MKPQQYIWPFLFYFMASAASAVYRPYIVLYFQSISLTGAQIGVLVGAAPLVTLVSLPLLAQLADRRNRHRLIIGISLSILVTGLILFPFLQSYVLLFAYSIVFAIFLSPVFPFANSATIVMLGHTLGMKVTVEGVENEAQFAMLRELGCDQFQGFLLSRPLAVAAARDIVTKAVVTPKTA